MKITNSDLSVMTFNIRNDKDDKGTINDWNNRRDLVVSCVDRHNPDIIGFQEVYSEQLGYLSDNLSQYSWIGVGRDDGINKGEFNPIFFKRRFIPKHSGTFWLSDSPEKCSNTWGGLNRVCTWVLFKEGFSFYNTHLEYLKAKIRIQSIELIKKKIMEKLNGQATILVGDLNFTRWSQEYKMLSKDFIDAYRAYNKNWMIDFNTTYHGFRGSKRSIIHWPSRKIIDYIWYTGNLELKSTRIINDTISNTKTFASDHWPLLARFEVK
ncbi:MAG: endonuclease/exonuclease/phosphatase family protein [Candidatus Hodarchaeales archaeon]